MHETPTSGLAQLTPGFNFPAFFFTQMEGAPVFEDQCSSAGFLQGLQSSVGGGEYGMLSKAYLTWHYVNASAILLTKAFVDAHFDFYGRVLTGSLQLRPRWKRCVDATDQQLGEALGRR